MTTEIHYRSAAVGDLTQIRSLLTSANLPADDIDTHIGDFILALADGVIVGCVGMEIYPGTVFLRSLAVTKNYRKRGVGKTLVKRVIEEAKNRKAQIYLLTLDAAGYFQRFGFVAVDRSEPPDAIRANSQFTELCPKTAVCMRATTSGLA